MSQHTHTQSTLWPPFILKHRTDIFKNCKAHVLKLVLFKSKLVKKLMSVCQWSLTLIFLRLPALRAFAEGVGWNSFEQQCLRNISYLCVSLCACLCVCVCVCIVLVCISFCVCVYVMQQSVRKWGCEANRAAPRQGSNVPSMAENTSRVSCDMCVCVCVCVC